VSSKVRDKIAKLTPERREQVKNRAAELIVEEMTARGRKAQKLSQARKRTQTGRVETVAR
jgi:hypothetical protein